MRLRVPGRSVSNGVRAQAPSNFGRADRYMPAQKELDNTVGRANARYLEAIAVDGVEVQYWSRGREGAFCSCHASNRGDFFSALSLNPVDGVAVNRTGDQNTSDGRQIGSFRVRGAVERREQRPNKQMEAYGLTIGELPTSEGVDAQHEFDEVVTDEELEKEADDEAVMRLGPDSAILFGGERTKCGICFGTGHVNGYSLVNGRREIFDTTHPSTSGVGFEIDRTKHPHTFNAPNDPACSISWLYELPTYFEQACVALARNNTVSARNAIIEYKIANTADAFAELSTAFLNSRRGTPTTLIIRVRPRVAMLESIFEFTHLEIIWQLAPWFKAQMPNISESTNFAIFDKIVTTEFTLPPTLLKAAKEDALYDFKHNVLWKVTDVTDFMTASRQVCGWTAPARFIQAYEQLALLRLVNEQNFNMAHGRLSDPIQGLHTGGQDLF